MGSLNVIPRTIFCKDNLDILEGINSECIDLIYLDPPFNKKKTFAAPVGSSAEGAEFSDIFREKDIKKEWVKSIEYENLELHSYLCGVEGFKNNYNYCYLVYMTIRLIECHRVLKDTGSIYLHCDPTMSHYLKIVMDCIFGEKNFRDEITWQRSTSAQKGSQHLPKSWGSNTDIILFYSKSSTFNLRNKLVFTDSKADQQKKRNKFPLMDEKTGERYYDDSSHIWSTPNMGARPNLCYEWKGFKNPHPSGWRLSKERLQEEYKKGNIVIIKNKDGTKKLQRRKYAKDYDGVPIGNLWTDINFVMGKESTNYPTQKPLALLERIIKASSSKNDVVLDPFCGCATTCVAAEKWGRNWIGIDVSQKAYELVNVRLKSIYDEQSTTSKTFPLLSKGYIEAHFTTNAPKRGQDELREQGYIYIISNDNWKGIYKVGIAKDPKRRLNSYQTSDPYRAYRLVWSVKTPHYKEIETAVHEELKAANEWIECDIETIQKTIEKYQEELS